MLTCPHCRSSNPEHHNFCQSCGRSLKHYICHNCSSSVELDAQSCPHCQAIGGTYWWAIIEPTASQTTTSANITSTVAVTGTEAILQGRGSANELPLRDDLGSPIAIGLEPSGSIQTELASPWDLPTPVLAAPVEIAPENLSSGTTGDDLETSPWDAEPPPTPSRNNLPSQPIQAHEAIPLAQPLLSIGGDPTTDSQPLVATTYLDPQCQYRLLDPVVIQLLTPSDSSQVRVIDRQPFRNSLLEILMEQQLVTLNHPDDESAPPGESPDQTHRQWQFWNSHGIPKVAQAYIALQVSLPGTIPVIRDGWDKDGKTVTIVEDRSKWTQLVNGWNDPQIPISQTIYWLDYTLKLWVALEPWQMRQSLLEIANLLLDEDARICFQRLYPEPTDRQLKLADLAQMWKKLFDKSARGGSDTSDRVPSSSLFDLIQSIQSGEMERVEEVRSRLGQIAYELEPRQLSAPLQPSGDLSIDRDPPTIGLAKKLIGLEDAAATHTGKKRDHNEDCFGIVSRIERQDSPKGKNISAQGLYILCDGMGGHAGGEIASSMTVDLLRDYFATRWGDTLPDEQTIREGIVAANEAVFEINQKNSAHGSGRMGTTLVLVLVQDQNIAVAHVGDSRCYGITPTQGLIQLTLDHEVGQQQILRGVDPEIAYGRPDSHQLTQAIGPRDRNYIAPDIRFFELQEDTLILLASDGLTDNQLLETYWLTNVAPLLSNDSNLQDGVDRLIDFANEYNGHDNITAMVVRAKLG
ncbi:MAG: serine/threonine phosphatase [Chamaesiphon sp.]|nr:serine/threonine phosphatase [Chamaesiphon sp.]